MESDDSKSNSKERDARVFDENGVDLTLIRHSLSLTPTERLKSVENFMNAMATVRRVRPASV
jgi:hypothetical protein